MKKQMPLNVTENKVNGLNVADFNMQKVIQFHKEAEPFSSKSNKRYRMYLSGIEIIIDQDSGSLKAIKELAGKYLDAEGNDYSSDKLVASKSELQKLKISPEGGEVLWEPSNYFTGKDPITIDEWIPLMNKLEVIRGSREEERETLKEPDHEISVNRAGVGVS